MEVPELHVTKELCPAGCQPYSFDTVVVRPGELIRYQCHYDLGNTVGMLMFEPENLVNVSVNIDSPSSRPTVSSDTLCALSADMRVPGHISVADAITH
jgi:hypothetical protein